MYGICNSWLKQSVIDDTLWVHVTYFRDMLSILNNNAEADFYGPVSSHNEGFIGTLNLMLELTSAKMIQ